MTKRQREKQEKLKATSMAFWDTLCPKAYRYLKRNGYAKIRKAADKGVTSIPAFAA